MSTKHKQLAVVERWSLFEVRLYMTILSELDTKNTRNLFDKNGKSHQVSRIYETISPLNVKHRYNMFTCFDLPTRYRCNIDQFNVPQHINLTYLSRSYC